jgi:hypothetical protein
VGKPKRTIVARRIFRVPEVIGDRHLINVTVGPDLAPVALSLEQEPDYRIESPGWAAFPKKRADTPNRFRIHHHAGGRWEILDLPETVENFHVLQPLGGDEWLLVRNRADDDNDRNAHVYDAAGRHVRSFHAGDGIQDVQATGDGKIWVSYFDEGVFGSTKLGRRGLVRLEGDGGCTFRFPGVYGGKIPDIVDCYALNVASDRETWAYYYTDFPVVKLVDGEPESIWPNVPVRGSSGFAVEGDVALFAGGYGKKENLYHVRLGEKRAKKIEPTDEEGRPLGKFWAFGRGDRLFLQTGEDVFKVEVADVERP